MAQINDYARLKIKGNGVTSNSYSIMLNDVEIAHLVTGLTIGMVAGEVNTVAINFVASEIDIELSAVAVKGEGWPTK